MPTSERPADHSARDSSIAVNSYTTVVGRAAVPEAHFRAYWRDAHGPLCSRVPGLGYYVQHHFARRQDAHLWPLIEGLQALAGYELDGAVEIGWASDEAQGEFQQASPILFSDEQNVFDETIGYVLEQGSLTVFDRELDPVPNGQDRFDRLHVHFTPKEGRAAELAEFLTGKFADAAAADPDVIKVRVHAPAPYDNSAPNPPAPNVAHTVPEGRLTLVVLEIAFRDPLARRRFFDSEGFAATLGRQAELASAVTAFPVSGVFTFVRDGELTTAGLRGSRVAELIRDLAAANQVGNDVQQLMHTGRID